MFALELGTVFYPWYEQLKTKDGARVLRVLSRVFPLYKLNKLQPKNCGKVRKSFLIKTKAL